MAYTAIVGIQDGLDVDTTNPLRQVPVRMELDDFCTSTDPIHKNQRALFFQALENFKGIPPTDPLSYFQIAGIHGQPFVPWEDDGKAFNKESGYCTHNSILFCTWHRPYMLLFEQVLYRLMEKVAGTFSDLEKPAMLDALRSWRFPYWDWAAKKPQPGGAVDDYDLPVVVPFEGVEIKVPAFFKGPPPSFDTNKVWSDPSVPEPGEHRRALRNPLYNFTMPNGYETMGDAKLGKLAIKPEDFKDGGVNYHYPLHICKGTTRHAEFGLDSNPEQLWIKGEQNNNAVRQALRNNERMKEIQLPGSLRAGLSDAFYRVVNIQKFEDFGTKRVAGLGPDKPKNTKTKVYDSAESLHDFIHLVCGGQQKQQPPGTKPRSLLLLGHMSNVPVAAFDPIFWIHHCNVDRLVAMWEILHSGNSDNWFNGSDDRDKDSGNWAIEKGHADLPSDPLKPFHKKGGSYWTSNDTRATAPHGYTYPQLEKWKHVDSYGNYDAAAHKAALGEYLNTRYNSAAKAAVKAQRTADPGDSSQASSAKPTLLQLQMTTPNPMPTEDIIGFNDYIVNIVYTRFALGGRPYTIHIFVGKVPDRVPYTFDDPEGSLVGQVYTFSSPADTLGTDAEVGCVNCRAQEAAEVESSGSVPLTNALITRWKNQLEHTPRQRLADGEVPRVLASMEPEDVVPFLETNLRWRVTSLDGLLSPDALPSLRVSVAVGKADHYADPRKMSRFYDYKGANEVTKDRPQGAGPDDGLYPPGQEYTVHS